jgi:LysR family hydrogen peroxide-inducible transcriptional activator
MNQPKFVKEFCYQPRCPDSGRQPRSARQEGRLRQQRPSVKQLEYFVAVAELQSFRRAAERLHISQPTLTAQIAGLEKLLGVQLFERSRAGTLLAPIGRELLDPARRALEELQAFVDAADLTRRGPSGTYRMGVTPTLGPYLLPHVLPAIHARHASLKFYLREAHARELEDGLSSGRHDVALMPLPLGMRELTAAPLFREPVMLVLPSEHRLAGKSRIEGADLRDEDVLTIEGQHPFHRQIEQICERFGARVLRDYEGTSLDALRHMVVMGMGVAFLPALYVRSEIRDADALRVTELAGEPLYRVHALVWRPGSPARTFFAALAQEIRDILAERLAGVVFPPT